MAGWIKRTARDGVVAECIWAGSVLNPLAQRRKMTTLSSPFDSLLCNPEDWVQAICESPDTRSVGRVLAACSQIMLLYWESHYRDDEKMRRVVDAMSNWAHQPSPENVAAVREAKASVMEELRYDVYRDLCMPGRDLICSNCPADFAGDSIYHAAGAIGESEHHDKARSNTEMSLRDAVEAGWASGSLSMKGKTFGCSLKSIYVWR